MPACRNFRTAVLTLICVIGLFLFPAAIGSFAATHGPVTALRSSLQAQQTKVSISTATVTAMAVITQCQIAPRDLGVEPMRQSAAHVVAPALDLSSSLRI
jgi:hypothetical protein